MVHSSVGSHSDCFYFSFIANNAAVNVPVQVFVRIPVFQFFGGCISRNGIAGLSGHSMFNFLRNHQTQCTLSYFVVCRWQCVDDTSHELLSLALQSRRLVLLPALSVLL